MALIDNGAGAYGVLVNIVANNEINLIKCKIPLFHANFIKRQ